MDKLFTEKKEVIVPDELFNPDAQKFKPTTWEEVKSEFEDYTDNPDVYRLKAAVVDRNKLTENRYFHGMFSRMISAENHRNILRRYDYQMLHNAYCNIGYYDANKRKHSIIVHCRNIAVIVGAREIITQVGVPTQEFFDITDNPQIDYVDVICENHPTMVVSYECPQTHTIEKEALNQHTFENVSWFVIAFRKEFKDYRGFKLPNRLW